MDAKLVRFHDGKDAGIIGVLTLTGEDGRPRGVAHTLEKPWRGNRPNESCIPPGVYTCTSRTSQKFGQTFEVRDVPGRTDILFHRGNFVEDTQGCILVGAWEPGANIVINSKVQMAKFREAFGGVSEFRLTIIDLTPAGMVG